MTSSRKREAFLKSFSDKELLVLKLLKLSINLFFTDLKGTSLWSIQDLRAEARPRSRSSDGKILQILKQNSQPRLR